VGAQCVPGGEPDPDPDRRDRVRRIHVRPQRGGRGRGFIEDVPGQHLDHYSPAEQGVLLRPEVHDGPNLMAVGIAAHETGHALQDADRHPLLAARTTIVLAATCGSLLGMILFIGGFLVVEAFLIYAGIAMFILTLLAQLFNLKVEFDASRRVAPYLVATGVIAPDEERTVRQVMRAAACTYVAATLTCIPTLMATSSGRGARPGIGNWCTAPAGGAAEATPDGRGRDDDRVGDRGPGLAGLRGAGVPDHSDRQGRRVTVLLMPPGRGGQTRAVCVWDGDRIP
jgi:Predicted Zn-dependent protease